jgi:hypothetical protein
MRQTRADARIEEAESSLLHDPVRAFLHRRLNDSPRQAEEKHRPERSDAGEDQQSKPDPRSLSFRIQSLNP